MSKDKKMQVKWTQEAIDDLKRITSFRYRFFDFFAPRKVKFFFQRLFKGYCDEDLWDLDYFILKKIRKPLKAFVKFKIKHGMGVPACLAFEKDGVTEKKDNGQKDWNNILKKIETAFDLMWEDYEMTEEWCKKTHEQRMKDDRKIAEGMRLFAKYFRALWD